MLDVDPRPYYRVGDCVEVRRRTISGDDQWLRGVVLDITRWGVRVGLGDGTGSDVDVSSASLHSNIRHADAVTRLGRLVE